MVCGTEVVVKTDLVDEKIRLIQKGFFKYTVVFTLFISFVKMNRCHFETTGFLYTYFIRKFSNVQEIVILGLFNFNLYERR